MNGRPRFASAYRELSIVAEDVRRNRAEGDPQLVAEDKMTPGEAADRLRIATGIATDWRCYAVMQLPPLDIAHDREKLATLQVIAAGAAARADRARDALISEYGEDFARRPASELWSLVDAHDPATYRVRPYLHHESYAAALEAMLWWQQRTGCDGIRFLISVNIELRARSGAGAMRAAA